MMIPCHSFFFRIFVYIYFWMIYFLLCLDGKPITGAKLFAPPWQVGILWETYDKTLQLMYLLDIPYVKPTAFFTIMYLLNVAVCCSDNQSKEVSSLSSFEV